MESLLIYELQQQIIRLSSVLILLTNKLVDKGIITLDEAKEIVDKKEVDKIVDELEKLE